MVLTPVNFVPYEMKTSLIKIVSYENKALKGLLLNPFYEGAMCFDNLIQLLFLIENMQDSLRFPQKVMESRTFKKDIPSPDKTIISGKSSDHENAIASFKINVLFRQNASWQGSIVWLEKQMESQFRSALEMIMLMDSVLSE